MSAKLSQTFPGAVMTAQGMQYNGAVFQQIVEKCEGCGRISEFDGNRYCSSYPMPEAKWSLGNCNFSTHMRVVQTGGAKVNPLKASKRAAKGGR